MIDGERRGYQLAAETFAPVVQELRAYSVQTGAPITLPSDEALGKLAADAFTEFMSRGYGNLEPKDLFLRGYAMAVRQLFFLVCQPDQDDETVAWDLQGGG